MKKKLPKVLVACNTLTSVSQGAYMDHINLTYALGKLSNKFQFHQMHARRMAIDRFRNWVAQTALSLGMDYILFIDDDMQFEEVGKVFPLLHASGYDIIAALNYIRGYPFDVMAFKYKTKKKTDLRFVTDKEVLKANGGIIDCDAIGTAVCLIRTSVLPSVPEPYFATGPNNTEDIYFCLKAAEYNAAVGKKIRIGIHTGVITGHVLDPEVISFRTKSHLKAYMESYMTKEQIASLNKKEIDRGAAYVAKNIEPRLRKIAAEEHSNREIRKRRSSKPKG